MVGYTEKWRTDRAVALRTVTEGASLMKVALIGAGRLAGLLAARLPAGCRKVIIGRHRSRAAALADEVGGIASDQFSAVRGCAAVLLAVPGTAVERVIQDLAPHLDPGALLVNMATDLPTAAVAAVFPRLRIGAAKLLGDVRELTLGAPGLVVLDHLEPADEERVRWLLAGLGTAIAGDEDLVSSVTGTMTEVLAATAETLRRRLVELGLERGLARQVVGSLGPGVFRSLTEGPAVPAARLADAEVP